MGGEEEEEGEKEVEDEEGEGEEEAAARCLTTRCSLLLWRESCVKTADLLQYRIVANTDFKIKQIILIGKILTFSPQHSHNNVNSLIHIFKDLNILNIKIQ